MFALLVAPERRSTAITLASSDSIVPRKRDRYVVPTRLNRKIEMHNKISSRRDVLKVADWPLVAPLRYQFFCSVPPLRSHLPVGLRRVAPSSDDRSAMYTAINELEAGGMGEVELECGT